MIQGTNLILYDKRGLFLGMGRNELSFLGYEDIDEFKNYCNDFADLFVNKPGYIVKFKNFSWIDYALHSGIPIKKAIIKIKTGKEVETELSIGEIYLSEPIGNSDSLYCIELSNSFAKSSSLSSIKKMSPQDDHIAEPIDTELSTTSVQNYEYSHSLENQSFEQDYMPEKKTELEESTKIKFGSELETFTPSIKKEISNDFKICDYDKTAQSLPFSEGLQTEDIKTDNKTNFNFLETEDLNLTNEDYEPSFVAEDLDVDIIFIAQLLQEYIDTLDAKMPEIKESLENKNLVDANNEIYKLKGIALSLRIPHLIEGFESLQKATSKKDTSAQLISFENLQSRVSKFKENLTC